MSAGKIINLVGARGYTGSELLGLVANHPYMELGIASSRGLAGEKIAASCAGWPDDGRTFVRLQVGDVAERPADAWVLALPNGLAGDWVKAIQDEFPASVIVDLSADHRFDPTWIYGVPEWHRQQLKQARLIANPGCYATGAQFGLRPLRDRLVATPVVFGVSGFSGAGNTPSPRNDPELLRDNLVPYAMSGHIHEQEISSHLHMDVRFMPHVAAFFRGISLTIAFEVNAPATADELEQLFRETYHAEPRVRVYTDIPQLSAVRQTPDLHLGGFDVDARNPARASLVVVLDNLLKGAASQALQNLNLALGLDENTGIDG